MAGVMTCDGRSVNRYRSRLARDNGMRVRCKRNGSHTQRVTAGSRPSLVRLGTSGQHNSCNGSSRNTSNSMVARCWCPPVPEVVFQLVALVLQHVKGLVLDLPVAASRAG